ncbi:MAG: LD-carboxypeptidase [Clostridia bacterium]|nr:LD-carboxypeptidase [Clostridia bacterium]
MDRSRSGAVVCCSDGRRNGSMEQKKFKKLIHDIELASKMKITPGQYIFSRQNSIASAEAKERADELMSFYRDDSITDIFDISGGDIANEILPYLDYNIIRNSPAVFWGYSDLTTIINAIYAKTGRASVLYQVRNIEGSFSCVQKKRFSDYFNGNEQSLFGVKYKMLVGNCMSGVVVGGNIRCFLKLAGTEYFPELQGKLLLLESLGGGEARMRTCLSQLKQLGAFEKISGIILGTFTDMQQKGISPTIEELVMNMAENRLPIAKTEEIGHGEDAKAVFIGKELTIQA